MFIHKHRHPAFFQSRFAPGEECILDESHPLAQDCCFFWVPSLNRDIVSGRGGDRSASFSLTVNNQGVAGNFINAGQYIRWLAFRPILTSDSTGGAGDVTIAAWANPAASVGPSYFFSQRNNTNYQIQMVAGRTYSNGGYAGGVSFQLYSSGIFLGASTASLFTDGNPHLFVGTRASGVCKIYSDGVDQTSLSANGTGVISAGGQEIAVGNLGSDYGTGLTGQMSFAAAWDRALTQQEIAWLYAEPWSMLRPVVRRRYGTFVAAPASSAGPFLILV